MNWYVSDEINNFYTFDLKYHQTRKTWHVFSNISKQKPKKNKKTSEKYKDYNEPSTKELKKTKQLWSIDS